MSFRLLLITLFPLVLLGACTVAVQQQGSVIKRITEEDIKPGVDTKESVQKRCGPPNAVSALPDAAGTIRWYYIHRIVSASPVRGQRGLMNAVVMIVFDKNGIVTDRQLFAGESKMPFTSKRTREPGFKSTLWHEAFANIGRFGQSKADGK
ncbi:MAG: outer membrane protein assembly factor BamE [Holosporales bacterium]|jgi:outer membrane protein assembly factor BamE (lipoprotein component of BamABCDE complex)|nr:outer membrane protein assembly factor BamE [Holosporales bacterium]